MTNAQFRRNLIHTCTVERNTPSCSASGEPIASWAEVATGVRCRLVQKRETLPQEGLSEERARYDLLLTGPDADIQEGDRVGAFLYLDGDSLDSNAYTVISARKRHGRTLHHKSFEMERIEP